MNLVKDIIIILLMVVVSLFLYVDDSNVKQIHDSLYGTQSKPVEEPVLETKEPPMYILQPIKSI